jgi:thiol-disulfide isomerase/thioredoxin
VLLAVVAVVVSQSSGNSPSSSTAANEETRPVVVTGGSLPALPDSGTDPAIGSVAPEVKGATFDGTAVSITHDGHPKLVLFAAHWCPHCQREVPLLISHLKDHPLPSGIELYLVATGTDARLPNYPPSAWLAKIGWTSPVLADDTKSTAMAFGLTSYPYFVALDAQSRVVARTSGEISVDDFDQLVARALAAK